MNRKDLPLNSKRPRMLGISFLVTLGLAVPVACGGGSSFNSSQKTPDGGGAGGTDGGMGATGGSGTGGSATGGSGTGGSATGGTGGTSPDAGADSGACVKRNGGVEICDGHDDNCDGIVDNVAVPGTSPQAYVGDPCVAGQSQCGVYVCPSFGTPKCSVDPSTLVETCDGKDDNCDGIIDNVQGIGTSCGQCGNGHLACPGDGGAPTSGDAGALGLVCVGDTAPQTETCDGKDDNCDGTVDNVLPANVPTCASQGQTPTSPSGLVCDGSGNAIPVTSALATCTENTTNNTASWTCPSYSPPVYYYLDVDGNGFPEPLPGMSGVRGPIQYTYNYGPYCNPQSKPATTPALPQGAKWITSTYNWKVASQRTADPYWQTHINTSINDGFDCCDTDGRAAPGETTYYQAKSSGGDNPLPSVCTGAGVNAWDFNCDGTLERQAPDGSSTPWNQNANNCNHVPGWDTLYPHPQDCGQTRGHWINAWGTGISVCIVQNYLSGDAPGCK